jgi:hypothetical protein
MIGPLGLDGFFWFQVLILDPDYKNTIHITCHSHCLNQRTRLLKLKRVDLLIKI